MGPRNRISASRIIIVRRRCSLRWATSETPVVIVTLQGIMKGLAIGIDSSFSILQESNCGQPHTLSRYRFRGPCPLSLLLNYLPAGKGSAPHRALAVILDMVFKVGFGAAVLLFYAPPLEDGVRGGKRRESFCWRRIHRG